MNSIRALLSAFAGRDFLIMGKGIEGRYARCKGWWEPHLRCTREFIERNMVCCSRVAVLGAGRLLDLDLEMLLEHCKEVHLFDADQSCVGEWRRLSGELYGKRIVPHVGDITGVLSQWTKQLRSAQRSGRMEEYLRSLSAPEPEWVRGGYDIVISLNVAGQIPLYWRDRVLSVQPSLTKDGEIALASSMGALQCAHLRGVQRAARKVGMVITDTEYYFYNSDQVEWDVQSALYGESRTVFREILNAHGLECWLWHLAPHHVESERDGEIHRVEARIFRNI